MRILPINNPGQLRQIMRQIKVDPYGIEIMLPKAIGYVIKINSLPSIQANILKQEMLSLGGDVAVAKDALTAKAKKTGCLVIGSLSQYNRLNEKLNKQPLGLNKLASELSRTITSYQKNNFVLDLGKFKLSVKPGHTFVCGILNLTPDSFSGDGLCGKWQQANGKWQIDRIAGYVEKMIEDGADIIDVGGESSRPGAKAIPIKEELSRTIPVIKALLKRIKIPISIDTYKPEVAKQALDNGAVMVNDITGLRNTEMVKVISKYKAGIVIMHMKGNPRTMQKNPQYASLIDELIVYLDKAINRALERGIGRDRIIIDPGLGFGKTPEHNLEILKNLGEFKILGQPILVGPSRKSFIGKLLNTGPKARLPGTIASCVLAVSQGANFVRVHDVKQVKQALKVVGAINGYVETNH